MQVFYLQILNTIDHLTESSKVRGAPNITVTPDYHLDSMSVSSDGCHSYESQDSRQVAKIYEQFHKGGGKEREDFGNVMEMKSSATWTKSYNDYDDDREIESENPKPYLEKEEKQNCSREVSVLHSGQRWDKNELNAWIENKRKNKQQTHDNSTRIETGRVTKNESIKKKVRLLWQRLSIVSIMLSFLCSGKVGTTFSKRTEMFQKV